MRARRGLTLIEVLAATVLMAMVAATCVPFLAHAAELLRPPQTDVTMEALAKLADEWIADHAANDTAMPGAAIPIPWPEQPDRPPVTIVQLTSQHVEADHTWLNFTCGELTVVRWIAVQQDSEEAPP